MDKKTVIVAFICFIAGAAFSTVFRFAYHEERVRSATESYQRIEEYNQQLREQVRISGDATARGADSVRDADQTAASLEDAARISAIRISDSLGITGEARGDTEQLRSGVDSLEDLLRGINERSNQAE